MAERPALFTVAPWGYRILVPSVVHAMGLRNEVRGFKLVSFTAMVAAGGVLFLFLRRRGAADGAALLGVALFVLSPPAARAVETPFYQEPVAILLILSLLLGIETGAGWGTLALLSALVTLTKDGAIVLTLVPAVLIARWRTGRAGALAGALALAIPATLFGPALRWWWTPSIPRITAERNLELVRVAWAALQRVWQPTALAGLVGGLVPLAIVGALQPKAREHLRRYGISLAMLIGLAFLGWLNVPSREPVPLFGDNFERLLLYSVPLLLPLGLAAIDRLWPMLIPPPAPRAPGRQIVPAAAAFLVIVLPFVLVDRYRRVDLQSSRDGPLVLALSRETWKMATRLAGGEEVVLDPEASRFLWADAADGGAPTRMRWFLREGWGPLPHYDTGPVLMRASAATVLLPALGPAELEARLRMVSPSPVTLALAVNGHALGSWRVGPEDTAQAFRIPARYLVRGDNLVTVTSPDGSLGARLLEVRYRRAPAA